MDDQALHAALYQEEFGKYLERVGPNFPVGVCSECLLLRVRQEIEPNPHEPCPASLLRNPQAPAMHNWQGHTDRQTLEAFVRERFPAFKALAEQAAEALRPE